MMNTADGNYGFKAGMLAAHSQNLTEIFIVVAQTDGRLMFTQLGYHYPFNNRFVDSFGQYFVPVLDPVTRMPLYTSVNPL